jgi:hypothetical protein
MSYPFKLAILGGATGSVGAVSVALTFHHPHGALDAMGTILGAAVSGWVVPFSIGGAAVVVSIQLERIHDRLAEAAARDVDRGIRAKIDEFEQQVQALTNTRGGAEGAPGPAFVCPRCLRPSWNPSDAVHGWCGACEAFTAPPQPKGAGAPPS